jgi:hypothetical protein
MAAMVGDLIEANVSGSPTRRRVAGLELGSVVLRSSERDLAVTVSFRGREVRVTGTPEPGAPALSGAWDDMARVVSGRRSPVAALLHRELRAFPRRPLRPLLAAAYVLKVPRSVYREGGTR